MCTRSSWGGQGVTDSLPHTDTGEHPRTTCSLPVSYSYSHRDSHSGSHRDKFMALQQISSSLQFEALFALLNKRPLRLQDGLDLFFRLDPEQGREVSVHDLVEECCTRSLGEDTATATGAGAGAGKASSPPSPSPSLSLELLADRPRLQKALHRLNHGQQQQQQRDGGGVITLDEWKLLLAELLLKDLHFAIEKAWASGLVYFAHSCTDDLGPLLTRGVPPSPPMLTPPPLPLPLPHTLTHSNAPIIQAQQQSQQNYSPPPPQTMLTALDPLTEKVWEGHVDNNSSRTIASATDSGELVPPPPPARPPGEQDKDSTDSSTTDVVVVDCDDDDDDDDDAIDTMHMHTHVNSPAKRSASHGDVTISITNENEIGCSDSTVTTGGGGGGGAGSCAALRESTVASNANVVRYGEVRRIRGNNDGIRRGGDGGDGGGGSSRELELDLSVLLVVSRHSAALAQLLQSWATLCRTRWGGGAAAAGGGTSPGSVASAVASAAAVTAAAVMDVAKAVIAAVSTAGIAAAIAVFEALQGLLAPPLHSLALAWRTSFLHSAAWRADFLYYEKNMNPLLGLLCCDPHHPLTFLERLDIEFCVYGWVFFTSALFALTKQTREQQQMQQQEGGEGLEEYRATNANKYIASFLLVTAPSMMLRVVLFYIFLCPCIVVRRKKKRSLLTRYVFPLLEGVGRAVGVATFLCSLCLYGFGLVMTLDLRRQSRDLFLLTYSLNWLLTNTVTYVLWDFCMYFNPFLCCAPSLPDESAITAAGTGAAGAAAAPVLVLAGGGAAGQRNDHGNRNSNSSSGAGWRVLVVLRVLWVAAERCLRWLGLAQWQVERRRAHDRLLLLRLHQRRATSTGSRGSDMSGDGGSGRGGSGSGGVSSSKPLERVLLPVEEPQQQQEEGEGVGSACPRAQHLSRVLSKPNLSVEVKKLQ